MLAKITTLRRYEVTEGVLEFGVPFPVYEAGDVLLKWSDDNGASETTLALDADYSVLLGDSRDTATVRLAEGRVPPGAVLAVQSNLPALQQLDLSHTAEMDTAAMETELDMIVQVIQQIVENMGRAVLAPATGENDGAIYIIELLQAADKAEDAAKRAESCAEAARACAEKAESIHDTLFEVSFSAHLSPTPNVAVEYTPETGMVHFYIPQGPQGIQGTQGEQGIAGPAGAQGPQGPQGPRGEQGATGPEGRQGIQGPQGLKGDAGARGPQGTPGPKGEQGDKGPLGDSPWGAAFGHFRLEGGELLMDYVGAEDAATFTVNASGELEVTV